MAFRERLTEARQRAGLSKRELSLLAGMAQAFVGMVERGAIDSPSGDALGKLATILGCSIDWLVLGIGTAPTEAEAKAAAGRARALASGAGVEGGGEHHGPPLTAA